MWYESLAFGGLLSNPSSEDLICRWLLLGLFPEMSVADGLRPSHPKDSSEAGVDEFRLK